MARDHEAERILVVKLADLGDVLLCEPAMRSLRAGHPNAKIDLLVPVSSRAIAEIIAPDLTIRTFPKQIFDNPRAAFRPDPLARALRFALALRLARYDVVVLLHHLTTEVGALKFRALAVATGANTIAGLDNGRGRFLTDRALDLGFGRHHEAEYMLRVAQSVGGLPVDPAPRLPRPSAHSLCGLTGPYVTLFPTTGPFSRAREWPASRFADLAAALDSRGMTAVVVGGNDASEAAREIVASTPAAVDLTGKTDLRGLFSVLSGARVAVGGDTFIGHAAAALGTPVVSIFGPSNRDAWRPFGSVDVSSGRTVPASGVVVYHDLPCEPCIYTGFSLGRRQGCPARTCLDRVEVQSVIAVLDHVMEVF